MKKAKNGAFVRDGVAVELVLDCGDEYEDVLDKASEVINLPEVPAGHHLTLVVELLSPRKWTGLSKGYLQQMHKAPAQICFGIGVIKKVSLLK